MVDPDNAQSCRIEEARCPKCRWITWLTAGQWLLFRLDVYPVICPHCREIVIHRL